MGRGWGAVFLPPVVRFPPDWDAVRFPAAEVGLLPFPEEADVVFFWLLAICIRSFQRP